MLQDKLFKLVLRLQGNVRLYHWCTSKYDKHLISDMLYVDLDPKLDELIENFIAKHGRPNKQEQDSNISITFTKMNDAEFLEYLKTFVTSFITLSSVVFDSKKDVDLMSIRDNIVKSIYKAMYLLQTR